MLHDSLSRIFDSSMRRDAYFHCSCFISAELHSDTLNILRCLILNQIWMRRNENASSLRNHLWSVHLLIVISGRLEGGRKIISAQIRQIRLKHDIMKRIGSYDISFSLIHRWTHLITCRLSVHLLYLGLLQNECV